MASPSVVENRVCPIHSVRDSQRDTLFIHLRLFSELAFIVHCKSCRTDVGSSRIFYCERWETSIWWCEF